MGFAPPGSGIRQHAGLSRAKVGRLEESRASFTGMPKVSAPLWPVARAEGARVGKFRTHCEEGPPAI